MYAFHHTSAYILASYERGETSRAYKLFTREKGMLYAYAQGVRELKNKNRFSLTTFSTIETALIQGRNAWRITSVEAKKKNSSDSEKNILSFLGKILPKEVPEYEIFDELDSFGRATLKEKEEENLFLYERIALLRILYSLGYVSRHHLPKSVSLDYCMCGGGYEKGIDTLLSPYKKEFLDIIHHSLTHI
jgi:recombinational DNA repair protein (RecF pathway)